MTKHQHKSIKTLSLIVALSGLAVAAVPVQSFAVALAPKPVASSEATEHCADQMGFMPRVRQSDITSIALGQRIVLIPVCEHPSIEGAYNPGPLFANGNVTRLRGPIARNSALMSVLRGKGYDQYDVVSLYHGGNNSILLYVHQRTMR